MKKKFRRVLSLFLTIIFTFSVGGCSIGKDKVEMGRYVEEKYEGPSGVYVQNLSVLENDKIGMIAYSQENGQPVAFISDDLGKSWTERSIELPKEDGKDTYTNNIGFLSNGKILLSYYFQETIPEIQEGIIDDSIEGEAENDSTLEEGIIPEDIVYEEPEFLYAVFDTDGTITNIDLDLSIYNDDESMSSGYNNFKCGTNGDVFFTAGSNGEKIVQFDGEKFEEKNIYEGNEWINDFLLVGDSLIIYDFESITEYDTTNGNEKGNLESLEKETISKNTNYYPTFLNSCSKDKLYYYTTLGLYEYDLKTEKSRQLVDSAISSFGDSDLGITSFIEKGNGEFLATFSDWSSVEGGSSIINFTYNPDIPSVPEDKLIVYSLTENYAVRQAISSYSKDHPDTYVKYEIGLSYEDGATQSDALKTLNTEIMAGNGPDVIILDGLSAESYIEKGLLEDISDVINPLVEDGSVFKNIAEAYNVDGKIYQFPATFKFPMLLGNKDNVNSVEDLDSLVEVTKQLSTENKKRIFSNYLSTKTLVYSLYYLYGNDWLNNDNTINEESLTNFFTKANEIYMAIQQNEENYSKYVQDKYLEQGNIDENTSVDSEEIIKEEEIVDGEGSEEVDEEYYEQLYEFSDMQFSLSPSIYADSFLFDDSSVLSYGGIDSIDGYSTIITALLNRSDLGYKILTRGEESIFIPSNIVGVNAKGKNKKEAKDIVKELLSDDNQKSMYGYGLPININTLKTQFDTKQYEENENGMEFDEATNHYISGSWGWSDDQGNSKEVKMLMPNEEDVNKLIAEIEKLNVAATVNTVLLTEVAKQFDSYALGEISLEDAINTVIDNLDLYLSE